MIRDYCCGYFQRWKCPQQPASSHQCTCIRDAATGGGLTTTTIRTLQPPAAPLENLAMSQTSQNLARADPKPALARRCWGCTCEPAEQFSPRGSRRSACWPLRPFLSTSGSAALGKALRRQGVFSAENRQALFFTYRLATCPLCKTPKIKDEN